MLVAFLKRLFALRGTTALPKVMHPAVSGSDLNSRETAVAYVNDLLALHREQEVASGWPDVKWGLFELGNIRRIVDDTASASANGREFLLQLEQRLSLRRENYESNPEAEYSSDLGRLGSVHSDLRGLLIKLGWLPG